MNNIRIREEDEWKAAFVVDGQIYVPQVMFFGLCNAPATFQRFMDTIMLPHSSYAFAYLDDVTIWSHDIPSLVLKTRRILSTFRRFQLRIKPSKCQFHVTTVNLLGFTVSHGSITPDISRLSAVQNWITPKTVKDVQKFLGFANFYRRFIPNYAGLAKPLTQLLRKDTPFTWNEPQNSAFTEIRSILVSEPTIAIPSPDKDFLIQTDASKHTIAAVLYQPDKDRNLQPVAYFSKTLNPAQQNYDIYNRELLAIIEALHHWYIYLYQAPTPTEIWTDHRNLTYFRAHIAYLPNRPDGNWNSQCIRSDFATNPLPK